MNDRNEALLVGTVVSEPRVGKTKTGGTIAQFALSIKRPEPSKASDIVNIVAWDEVAEDFHLRFESGSRVEVLGRIQKTSYVGNDGTRRSLTKVYAQQINAVSDSMENVLSVSVRNSEVNQVSA